LTLQNILSYAAYVNIIILLDFFLIAEKNYKKIKTKPVIPIHLVVFMSEMVLGTWQNGNIHSNQSNEMFTLLSTV